MIILSPEGVNMFVRGRLLQFFSGRIHCTPVICVFVIVYKDSACGCILFEKHQYTVYSSTNGF